MAEIFDLDVTDADNTGRFPEGQAPSTVNNGARALEGILARGLKDTINPNKTTTGSANAQALTPNATVATLTAGMMFTWKAGYTNTAAMTLNVADTAATGAKSVKTTNGSDPWAGAVTVGGYYTTIYDGTNHILLNPSPFGLGADIVQDASGNLTSQSVPVPRADDWSFAAGDRNKPQIVTVASKTGTLLAVATAGNGWATTVQARVAGTVITSPATDIFLDTGAAVASYTMSAGETVLIRCNGSSYLLTTINRAASAVVAGVSEFATTAETRTGTDATRAVTPDGFSGASLGYEQEWKVAPTGITRAVSTFYTNDTNKPIQVAITIGNVTANIEVGGVVIAESVPGGSAQSNTISFIVQPGAAYRLNSASFIRWAEFRS